MPIRGMRVSFSPATERESRWVSTMELSADLACAGNSTVITELSTIPMKTEKQGDTKFIQKVPCTSLGLQRTAVKQPTSDKELIVRSVRLDDLCESG